MIREIMCQIKLFEKVYEKCDCEKMREKFRAKYVECKMLIFYEQKKLIREDVKSKQ